MAKARSKERVTDTISKFFRDPEKPSRFSGLNKVYDVLRGDKKIDKGKYGDLKSMLSKQETYQMYKL